MGDKFWWWLKRIRFLAACLVGCLGAFYIGYKSSLKSDLAGEIIAGGIAIVTVVAIYYVPEWIAKRITHTDNDEDLATWMYKEITHSEDADEVEEWKWIYKQKKKDGGPENEDEHPYPPHGGWK